MDHSFVDSDVILRLLTADDLRKQAAAARLFEAVEAGDIWLAAPDTVVADVVYVLSSPRLYAKRPADVYTLLIPLLKLAGFRVANKRIVLRALEVFAEAGIDFGDAMIVAAMEKEGTRTIYSYDRDFERIRGIKRLEP